MNAIIIRADQRTRIAELSHAECIALSELVEVAAIVATEETLGGLRAAYIDGELTQYDPVSGELLGYGRHDEPSGRNGWVS